MSFMQRQVTGSQNWLRVETRQGTTFVDSSSLCLFVRNSDSTSQPLSDEYAAIIAPYVDGIPQQWENIKGFGARLSAPGYMDCTDWCVFGSEDEANEYLADNYEDEDEPVSIRCDQCEALMINGMFCHESGCPNSKARYDNESGSWIKQYKCFECGYMADIGSNCCQDESEAN